MSNITPPGPGATLMVPPAGQFAPSVIHLPDGTTVTPIWSSAWPNGIATIPSRFVSVMIAAGWSEFALPRPAVPDPTVTWMMPPSGQNGPYNLPDNTVIAMSTSTSAWPNGIASIPNSYVSAMQAAGWSVVAVPTNNVGSSVVY